MPTYKVYLYLEYEVQAEDSDEAESKVLDELDSEIENHLYEVRSEPKP